MTNLITDLSVSPYFDDYDASKNFHRILFRASKAVQARELNQLQTILQDQVKRVSSYFFKDGAIVDGCPISYIPKFEYVHLTDQFNSNSDLSLAEFDSSHLVTNSPDSANSVRAVIEFSNTGYLDNYPNTNRVYVSYIRTGLDGSNNEVTTFQSGDTLYFYANTQDKLGTLDANNLVDTIEVVTANATVNATGQAYGIRVGEGQIYQKGHYINVNTHIIPVVEFTTNVNSYVVGFETTESIVTSDQDSSLLDNAAGSSNFNAPGAYRLKLSPSLVSKTRSETANNKNFFAIAEFDSNQPTEQNTGEESLNKILEILAGRTREESGDYVVNPFAVETIANANSELFDYEISPGIIYVKGYRKEKLSTFSVSVEKASTTREAQAQIVTANYGNYVLVDEAAGVFDIDNLDEISLYDTAQNCISEYEGANTAPSGNVVGYANIRGFQYDSGLKGTPDARYRLYLFNVRMDSGKSFANDVKALYATSSFGDAKADVVLESDSTAQIKDASRNTLVFPIGVDAVRRLRDSGGVNDTQFVTRDISSATLAANGFVTFTINTPANGGDEKINASVGTLSDTNETNFNIILSEGAYSANLVGTVDITNANGVILDGTSTLFDDHFANGELIRIDVSGSPQIRRVVSVNSNTEIVLDADVSGSNTGCTYQKYYPPGHIVDTSGANASINVLSNTQFSVDTDLDVSTGTLDSGTQTVYAEYPVLRSTAVQTSKEVKKSRYVKIDCSNNAATSIGPWNLGVSDVSKIRNIYVGTTYANTNPERSTWFVVDNGQRESYYDHGRLLVKSKYANNISSATKILVEMDYFTANTTAGVGFFSVDSYPIDDANTANATAITTGEIPLFYSDVSGGYVDLRNAVDFRPRKFNTSADATTIGAATINPVTSNTSFDVAGDGQYIADPDSNFQADLEYYLPRIDLIVMNKQGDVTVRQGEPNENPVAPKNEGDTTIIARADVAPYPSLTTREADAYNRRDIATKTSIKTTKRYTMKDIGALEDRIKRMEYYTTLNLLEQQAKDLVILDENGLDRFKNGIFADSFRSHLLGKVDDIEYDIAIDKDQGIARPKFETHDVDFVYDANTSSGITKTGHLLTRPFTNEVYVAQRFATKFRNCVESVWKWNGNLNLYPDYDHFQDETRSPNINIDLDLTAPWEDFVNSSFGTIFGDWRTVNTSRSATGSTQSTTTTSQRVIQNLEISDIIQNTYDFGDYVTDVSMNPYMRSRMVAFVVSGMKPNTRMHAFFDGDNVDAHCAPGTPSGITEVESGREDRIVERTGDFGDTLTTGDDGTLYGVFRIPEGEFRVGDRQFMIANVDDLETGADAITTSAGEIYTASSISVNKRSATISTSQPQISLASSTQTNTSTVTTSIAVSGPRSGSADGAPDDPIAQSFKVVVPNNESGMFASRLGVYFRSKDPVAGATAYIVETTTGLPDTSKILASAHLPSANVSVSSDASVETVFQFDSPVFLDNQNEYAFVIKPDGNSPNYEIWVSETGNFDVTTEEQVYSNPYSGVLFISANFNTWTPKQLEDIKFNLYRANFTTGTGTAILKNEDDDYLTVDGFTKANTTFRVEVGDVVVKLDGSNTIISDSANSEYGYGIVQYINEADSKLYVDSSTGTFEANGMIEIHRPANNVSNVATFSNTTLIATSTVESIDNLEYHSVVPRFATLEPSKTSIAYKFKGTNGTYGTDSSYVPVIGETEREFLDRSRFAVSRTNEVDNMSENKSTFFQLSLSTTSSYVSPVVDLRRKTGLFIENLINNSATNEHTRYGEAQTKYISRNVTLDETLGDAEDLKVFLGAYKPVGTDIKVYAKILGSDDGDVFDEKLWTELSPSAGSATLYSSPLNTNDFREFEFNFPTSAGVTVGSATSAYLNDGIVEYARSDGSIVVGFKTFCFKIVLLSEDGYRVPRLNDLRAIALQK